MNELQIFENPEFGEIRGMEIDGEPWFVGKDVAEILGYTNPHKAIRDHVDDEDKGVNESFTPGGKQNIIIINESGLYSLILSSKLPSTKRFKRWITSEVLPALRKNHTYTMPEVPQGSGSYRPTRPLTTDDYEDAARTIAKCHNSRLPMVIDLYRKAGLNIQDIPVKEVMPVTDEQREAEFVKLLKRYELKELCEKLQMPKTSIYYYRIGKVFPHDKRYKAIIKILEG